MEGTLAKKTTGGKWKTRHFKIADGKLSWFKSDNKTILSVDLTGKDVAIRDVKFGVRKFVFEVSADGRVLQLAASGETEKQEWINALEKATGKKGAGSASTAHRPKSVKEPKKIDTTKVAGIANALGLINTAGAGPGASNAAKAEVSTEAVEKLRQKLAGTAIPVFGMPPPLNRQALSNDSDNVERVKSSDAQDANKDDQEGTDVVGKIDNSAALSRPAIKGRRQAPQRLQSVAKLTPPVDIKDKIAHENSFRLETGTGVSLVAHASSNIEKEKWTQCIANAIQLVKLKHELETAQRVDMKSAIQAQINLESYNSAFHTAYAGYLEKLSVKSQRNWKKRYFELKDGFLKYYADENSKKEIFTIELNRFSVVKDHEGRKIEAQVIADLAEKKVGNDAVLPPPSSIEHVNSSNDVVVANIDPIAPSEVDRPSSANSGKEKPARDRENSDKTRSVHTASNSEGEAPTQSPKNSYTTGQRPVSAKAKRASHIVDLEKKKGEELRKSVNADRKKSLEARKSDITPGRRASDLSDDVAGERKSDLGARRSDLSMDPRKSDLKKSEEKYPFERKKSDQSMTRKKTEESVTYSTGAGGNASNSNEENRKSMKSDKASSKNLQTIDLSVSTKLATNDSGPMLITTPSNAKNDPSQDQPLLNAGSDALLGNSTSSTTRSQKKLSLFKRMSRCVIS